MVGNPWSNGRIEGTLRRQTGAGSELAYPFMNTVQRPLVRHSMKYQYTSFHGGRS